MERPTKVPWMEALNAFNQNQLLRTAKHSVKAKNLETNMVLTNFLIAGTASGARIELSASLMAGYNASGVKQFWIEASDGKGYFAGGNAYFDSNGANFLATASGSNEYLRYLSNVASGSKLITEQYINNSLDADTESWKNLYSDNTITKNATARIGLQLVGDSGATIATAKLYLQGSYGGGADFLRYSVAGSLMMAMDGNSGNLSIWGSLYPGTTAKLQTNFGLTAVASGIQLNSALAIYGQGLGIGSLANYGAQAATDKVITMLSPTTNVLEMVTTAADAAGQFTGIMSHYVNANSVGHKYVAAIAGITEGATANQRGGKIQFYCKATASTALGLRMSIDNLGHVYPNSAGLQNLGNASSYWGDVSYKTLTDRGCIVEVDPDLALSILKGVNTQPTRQPQKKHQKAGLKIHKYSDYPDWIYDDGKVTMADGTVVQGEEGVDVSGLISLHEAAIKGLEARLAKLEKPP